MKKSLLIVLGCIVCIFFFQAFTVTNDPQFKNLQILPKDISEHDLDSVMHHFSQSLGVKCNFCHVRNEDAKKMDFASDDKPEKNIARKMMLMAIDINKNYFTEMEMGDMHHDMDHNKMEMGKDSMSKNKGHDMEHDMMSKKTMDTTGMNNSRYMLMEVNCYTCHRGAEHPDSKLPPPKDGPKGPPSPQIPADK
ncbi:MAG: c-type cytochrome [Ginsengibacter sp.]